MLGEKYDGIRLLAYQGNFNEMLCIDVVYSSQSMLVGQWSFVISRKLLVSKNDVEDLFLHFS